MRELFFAIVLMVAAACVVIGVAWYTTGGAFIVAGVLIAGIGWLILGGTQPKQSEP